MALNPTTSGCVDCGTSNGNSGSGTIIIDCDQCNTDGRCFNVAITSPADMSEWCDLVPISGTIVPCAHDTIGCADYIVVYSKYLGDYECLPGNASSIANTGSGWDYVGSDTTLEGECPTLWGLDWPICCEIDGWYVLRAILYNGCDVQVGCPSDPVYVYFDKGVMVSLALPDTLYCGGVIEGCLNQTCDCVDYILITAEYMGDMPKCEPCMPTRTYVIDRAEFKSAMCCDYTFDVFFNDLYCEGEYKITATPYADCTDNCIYDGVQIGESYVGYLEIIRGDVCFEILCPAPVSPECGMTLCGPINFKGILNDPCSGAKYIEFYAEKTGEYNWCSGACYESCNACDGEEIISFDIKPTNLPENICPKCGTTMNPIICGPCGGTIQGYKCPNCPSNPGNPNGGTGVSECICQNPADHGKYISKSALENMIYLGSTYATMPNWSFVTNEMCNLDSGCYKVYAVVIDSCECDEEYRYDDISFAYCNERELTIELDDCIVTECIDGEECTKIYKVKSGTVTARGNITVPTCWINYPEYVGLEYSLGQMQICGPIIWGDWIPASCIDGSITWNNDGECLKSGVWETTWCTPEDIESKYFVKVRGVAKEGCGEFYSGDIKTSIYNKFDVNIFDPCEGNTIYNGKVIRGFVWAEYDGYGGMLSKNVCLPDHVDLYWRPYGAQHWAPMDSAFLHWKNSEQYIDFMDYGIDPGMPKLPKLNYKWGNWAYWDVTWTSCMVNCVDNGHYEIKAVVEPCIDDECGTFERAEYIIDVWVDDTSGVMISKPFDGQTVCDNLWVYGTAVGAGVTNVDFYVSTDNVTWTLYKEDIDVNVNDGRWKAPLNTCCFEDGPLYLKAVVVGPCDISESTIMVNVLNAIEMDLTCPNDCVCYVNGDKMPIRGTLTGCDVDNRVENVKVYMGAGNGQLIGIIPAKDFRYVGDGVWEWGMCFNPCVLNGGSTQLIARATYRCGNNYFNIDTGPQRPVIQHDPNLKIIDITGPGSSPSVGGTVSIEGTLEGTCIDYLTFEYRKICEPNGQPLSDWMPFPGVSVLTVPEMCMCEICMWTFDIDTCGMDGLYEIRVKAFGWPCGEIASDTDFIRINNKIGITLDVPAINSGIKSGTIEVSGTVENCPVIDRIELYYVLNGDFFLISDEITCSNETWSYMWDTTTVANGGYCLIAYAYDDDCDSMASSKTRAICIENNGVPPVINETNDTIFRECVKIETVCYVPCTMLRVTFNDTVSINDSYNPASPLDGFEINYGNFGPNPTMEEDATDDHVIIINLGTGYVITPGVTEIKLKPNQTAILGPNGIPIVDCSAELKTIPQAQNSGNSENSGVITLGNMKMFSVPCKVNTGQMVGDAGVNNGAFVKFTNGKWEAVSEFKPLEGYVYIGTFEGDMPIYIEPLLPTDTPPEIQLASGWNLVGVNTYGGSFDPVPCNEFLGTAPISKLLEFSSSGWLKLNGGSNLVPTNAYWAYADSGCSFAGQ